MSSVVGPIHDVIRFDPALAGRRDVTSDDGERWRQVADAPAPLGISSHSQLESPLEIRQVSFFDLRNLRRVNHVLRLHQPEVQLMPYSPLRGAVVAAAPGLRARHPFVIVRDQRHLLGFAHFQPVGPDQRWQLLAVGAATPDDSAIAVWDASLTYGVRSAGLRGVKRLYARAPRDSAIGAALRAVAWQPYASETIFAAYDFTPGLVAHSIRPQGRSDTWSIHQLYNAAVPRDVHYAEAFTSHRWEIPARRGRIDPIVQGWIAEEDHHAIGYARMASNDGTHALEAVYEPGRADCLPALLDAAVAGLATPRIRRLYCSVRGYQAELASVLQARGFAAVLEQDLHVKYTTVQVRAPAVDAVPFHVEVRDVLPKRVPSFLHGPSRDDLAT
jgi:hypothetical protein